MQYSLDVVQIQLIKDAPILSEKPVKSVNDAVALMAEQLSLLDKEVMCVLNMSADMKAMNMNVVSMGTINQAPVSPKDLFKSAILNNSVTIIMMHNHPSGQVTPSYEDLLITRRIVESGRLLDINVADHIIVGGRTSERYSFCENQLIQLQELDQKIREIREERYAER